FSRDWSSDVCSSDLVLLAQTADSLVGSLSAAFSGTGWDILAVRHSRFNVQGWLPRRGVVAKTGGRMAPWPRFSGSLMACLWCLRSAERRGGRERCYR